MTNQEAKLLIELALIVHSMAPPDVQRRIDHLLVEMQYQDELPANLLDDVMELDEGGH